MKISVFGLGYVGMTSALMYCESGHQVHGLELVKTKRDLLKRGELHLYEEGLKELLDNHLKNHKFSVDESFIPEKRTVAIITVGTPANKKGFIDLSQVKGVLKSLIKDLNQSEECDEVLFVLRSTVPVGACENEFIPLLKEGLKSSLTWDFVYHPEFLREGQALEDFRGTDEALVASYKTKALERWKDFFIPLPGFNNTFQSSFKVAEMAKLSFNSFNALRVSFVNELYSIAGAHGVSEKELYEVNHSLLKRQKSDYLSPGFSYGGHCLSKDLNALINLGRTKNLDTQLLRSINESNEDHFFRYLDFIEKREPKAILLCGLTFKPKTDDARGSFVLRLAKELMEVPSYKTPRKIYILEENLAYEKALPTLKGLDCERVSIAQCKNLAVDTVILGPFYIEETLRMDFIRMAQNVFDLKFFNYPEPQLLHPFKEENES